MKLFYLCILSISFLFSCSEASDVEVLNSSQVDLSYSNKLSDSTSLISPFNPANSYDYVGQLHHELYLEYYAQQNDSLSLSRVITKVEALANQNVIFESYFATPYHFYVVNEVSNLIVSDTLCIDTILANSALTIDARNKMKTFLSDFNFQFEKNIESGPVLEYVFQFENQIINSKDLLESDKAILLSTTSIARFSVYESKRRPKKNTDPDWDSLITSLYGAFLGDENSVGDRIVASLVCGIKTNE